jgi:hypothetical protein
MRPGALHLDFGGFMKLWILIALSSLACFAGVPSRRENQNNGLGGAAALAGVGIALTLIGYVRRQE